MQDGEKGIRAPGDTPRHRAITILEDRRTQYVITAFVVANAAIIGCETSPSIMDEAGGLLKTLDKICLAVFVTELVVKI